MTERFLAACLNGDIDALMDVLAADVTLHADSGGKTPGPCRPIYGADRVARLFGATAGNTPSGTTFDFVAANGGPAAVALLDNQPYAIFFLDFEPDGQRITAIRVIPTSSPV